ncbi:MAG: metallophosphoesterase family protein [Rhodothermales bacterium]
MSFLTYAPRIGFRNIAILFFLKLAILSDIHSNLEALTEVLRVISSRDVDATYCLGDVVGYGADPATCVNLVRAHCTATVLGNHDEAVATGNGLKSLPRDARKAALHNRTQLSEEHLSYLAGLPLTLEADACTFVHASPGNPAAWQRLDSYLVALEQFHYFRTDVCFIGHSHVPAVMGNKLGVVRVRPGMRYLINAGSVGQPRDGDPRACVAFFDTDTFDYELVRVPYDIEAAAAKITNAGLPRRLAKRLFQGV